MHVYSYDHNLLQNNVQRKIGNDTQTTAWAGLVEYSDSVSDRLHL